MSPSTGTEVRLVSVNVSEPVLLGLHRGQPVMSGIAKKPVAAAVALLGLTTTNLEGDGQADLESHGGPDKAVYAYPSEHLAAWSRDLGEPLGPAAFGENLTTAGWAEADVRIGDVWAWGDASLQVCQPRWPCFKLALYRGRGDIGPKMRETGRTGWYLRVIEPGTVPTAGPIIVVERHPAGVTVRDAHEAARPGGASPEEIGRCLGVEELAAEWRWMLTNRLVNRPAQPAG